MKRSLKWISFLLLFTIPLFASEVITGFEEKDLPVVNEEFRRLRKAVLWEQDGDVKLEIADDIDFQQKEAKQLVIENRTSDPSSPVTGEIWIRTDL